MGYSGGTKALQVGHGVEWGDQSFTGRTWGTVGGEAKALQVGHGVEWGDQSFTGRTWGTVEGRPKLYR